MIDVTEDLTVSRSLSRTDTDLSLIHRSHRHRERFYVGSSYTYGRRSSWIIVAFSLVRLVSLATLELVWVFFGVLQGSRV